MLIQVNLIGILLNIGRCLKYHHLILLFKMLLF